MESVSDGVTGSMVRASTLLGMWLVSALGATASEPAVQKGPEELTGVERIVFAVRAPGKDDHWFANFGNYASDPQRRAYEPGGKLCVLDVRSGKVVTLLEDEAGGVRDPQVAYDAGKILFAYRKGDSEYYHLYEIGANGGNLRQLTDGRFDDIEPSYLPDGGIVFCSTRCNRFAPSWDTRVATMYRCDADGSHIRPVSSNTAQDNTPWPLADGRVLYTRWELVNRSEAGFHHLWANNPDGTGEMTFFGNLNPGDVMIDAKPIPNSRQVVAIFSPGHGRREHEGRVTIVSPALGPDEPASAKALSEEADFRDPYALGEDCFLVARGAELLVMDGQGAARRLYELPEAERRLGMQLHEPRPVLARAREHIIPPRVDRTSETGVLLLANVYAGRNMAGIEPGEIKSLLVLEVLPKPVNLSSGMEPVSLGGSYMLERVLGTVPVEEDGSAWFEVPAMRSLVLVALDERGRSVKRMQSFVSVMPGEIASCVGCHERRTQAVTNPSANMLATLNQPPSTLERIRDVPEVIDFPRDVQPILNRHCLPCHGYEATEDGGPRMGKVILTGDRGPVYSHSYYMLTVREQMADGRNRPVGNLPPRSFGSGHSRLMEKIDGTHHRVRLTQREQAVIRLWLDTGATYPGTYAALGTGMIGGYVEGRQDRSDLEWPGVATAKVALARRCAGCHTGEMRLPDSPSDDMDMPPWKVVGDDPRMRYSRHIVYNLSRPEKSMLLLAPLSKAGGGLGICRPREGGGASGTPVVFADTDDADYATLLAAVRETKKQLDRIRRFDMNGFKPSPAYLRELAGSVVDRGQFETSADEPAEEGIDIYASDLAYWRSLGWKPEGRRRLPSWAAPPRRRMTGMR